MPAPASDPNADIFDAEAAPVEKPVPKEEPVAKVAAAEAPKHSARSLRLAEEFGFSAADIRGMSPEELDAAVYHQQLAVNRMARQMGQADMHRQAMDRQPEPAPAPPANPEDEFSFTEEQYPAEIVKLANVAKQSAKEARELKEELKRIREGQQARDNQTMFDLIDAGFDNLGAEYESLIGAGSGSEMDVKSPEFRRRLSIIRETGLDITKPIPARKLHAAIRAAAEALYPPNARKATVADDGGAGVYANAAAVEPKKSTPPKDPVNGRFTRDDYANGALATPTNRSEKEKPPGPAKARESVTAALRDKGRAVDEGRAGDVQLDDFLGN